jgi:hypothetical protein
LSVSVTSFGAACIGLTGNFHPVYFDRSKWCPG